MFTGGVKMLLYIFSDFQGEKTIPDGSPDLVILLGDICYRDAVEIDKKYSCPKIGVYGNHDTIIEWKETDIQLIHETTFEFKGVTFGGFGGCPRYNRKPNQYAEEQCWNFIQKLDYVDVFIAHSNPAYDLTLADWDAHRGFKSFNHYISEKKPKYFLHGHLHKPYIKQEQETTICSVYPFLKLNI